MLALFSGALILLVIQQEANGQRRTVWNNPIMTFFGKYSYAMYLIHLPLVEWLSYQFTQARRFSSVACIEFSVLTLGGTILLALLSWNLIEKQFLSLKRFFDYVPNGIQKA